MSGKLTPGYISLGILLCLLAVSGVWHAVMPVVKKIDAVSPQNIIKKEEKLPLYTGNHVIVNLSEMQVELRNGTSSLQVMPILSTGKPGSYYETLGGSHKSDYKLKKHFSSIGHVYMPWSTHVFGNFFIHGIPYHPDGTQVQSTYSGGCIRLENADAKKIFDFVAPGTPIIITQKDAEEFSPTLAAVQDIESISMTHLMVATISLEVLAQDKNILDTDGKSITTRRKLLPRLINDHDSDVALKIAENHGEETFVNYMNTKAEALGLTNTTFTGVNVPALTTRQDMEKFAQYITSYKTYLLSVNPASTQQLSQ